MERLERVHGGATGAAAEQGKKQWLYDADHERRRKEQLRRLYNRTEEQLEEEEVLKAELRKIEARKREREKKTADLQKMIAQADASSGDPKKLGKKQKLAAVGGRLTRPEPAQVLALNIQMKKFPIPNFRWRRQASGGRMGELVEFLCAARG